VFVVDTNVLVYAADVDAPAHARCRELLEEWRRQSSAWYTTWGVLYEFLRITTHPRVLRSPWSVNKSWFFVEAMLGSTALSVLVETERHASVVEEVLQEVPQVGGNVVHDAHTAILMREHGIRRIYTRDTDFHRFPFLEVIDPLAR
jgi:toxin-antitoxin system PIN domain toxin